MIHSSICSSLYIYVKNSSRSTCAIYILAPQQNSNQSDDNKDVSDNDNNSSGESDDTSGGSGGNSSDDEDDSGDDSGDSGDDSGDSGDDSGDSGDDSGDSGDDSGDSGDDSGDSSGDSLYVSVAAAEITYELVEGEKYPAYILGAVMDGEGNEIKIWLEKESTLYQGISDNGLLEEFETIIEYTVYEENGEVYGVGKINEMYVPIAVSELLFTKELNIDATLDIVDAPCTFSAAVGLLTEDAKLIGSDIVLGSRDATGSLAISSGSVKVDNIRSINGQIMAFVPNALTVTGQIINWEELTFSSMDGGTISCATLVNDGSCIITNMDNEESYALEGVTLINNSTLQIGSGIHLKKWENTEGSYFEHKSIADIDDTMPIYISDGLIISELQRGADVVYLSTDDTTAVTGTFEGENKLTYATDSNGDPCFILVTGDASGDSGSDSGTTGADSYTGQIVSYSGTSITILNDETSQNETITLGTNSPMLSGLNSNGVLTEFKVIINKEADGSYKVLEAEQTSANAITLNEAITMRDETIRFVNDCTISNAFNLYGSSAAGFKNVYMIMGDNRPWIQVENSCMIDATNIYVTDVVFEFEDMAVLNIMNTLEVSDGILDWLYSPDAQIGIFDLNILSGSCWISCEEQVQNDVFMNVSIYNNGELVIDDTTVNSLTFGDNGTVEYEGDNFTNLNP